MILDPSALIRGIGHIRKWVEKYNLVIFIPEYTLRELDFTKRGVSLMATNARESIRLIDKMSSLDDEFMNFHTETQVTEIKSKVLIQTPEEAGPNFKTCLKYKRKNPLVKDFPNYKTEFDSLNSIGLKKVDHESKEEVDINSKAVMPLKLRFLIRSCYEKKFNDRNNWIIVAEDPIVRIWLKTFNLDTSDLTQLENLLTNNNSERTLYDPTSKDELVKEKFETMDYADRGKGQLWTP